MARVYKTVMVNGRPMKKWVEEYAVFEFDEDGKMTFPETFDSDERYEDYDEKGNRIDLPELKGIPKDPKDVIEKFIHFDGKRGQLTHEQTNNGWQWTWRDKNGTVFWSERDYWRGNSEFDSNGHLVSVGDKIFEYEENSDNLIHITECHSVAEGRKCVSEEVWFEYDNDIIQKAYKHYPDISDCEDYYEYDENGNLIYQKSEGEYGDDDEIWYKYDAENRRIHEKWNQVGEENYREKWYDYDAHDNIIQEKGVYSQSFNKLGEYKILF